LTTNRLALQTIGVEDHDHRLALDALQSASRWRSNVRALRHDCWFALVTFGVVTLAASPFLWRSVSTCPRGCGSAVSAFSVEPNPGPLGNPFVYGFVATGIGKWISLYWVIAVPLGFLVTTLYYRRRARQTGLDVRIGPAVGLGLVLIVLFVVFTSNFLIAFHIQQLSAWFPVFTIRSRGLGPLLIIGISLGVLAVIDHRRSLAALACVFLAISILANVNLNGEPPGVSFHLPPSAEGLPNLIVPGLILIGGGIGFWWSDKRTTQAWREN
jgi:hypothetical protein